MSQNLRLYTRALYGFDHVVRLAPPEAWSNESPCEGWTARHVLGHVNAVQRYIESLIEGREPTMNPMQDLERNAGDDPAATWAATLESLLAALDQPGVLQRVVQSFWGEITVDDGIGRLLGDVTIHSWDLARAFGVDDRLDPILVEAVTAAMAPNADNLAASGMFAARVDVGDDADAQAQLLAMSGRRP